MEIPLCNVYFVLETLSLLHRRKGSKKGRDASVVGRRQGCALWYFSMGNSVTTGHSATLRWRLCLSALDTLALCTGDSGIMYRRL